MKKITFCEQNLDRVSYMVFNILKEKNYPDCELRITRCLAECGECFSNYIADYHGQLLVENTPERLLNRIIFLLETDRQ